MFYKDIGKSAADFFKKGFPTNNNVEILAKGKNGEVKMTSTWDNDVTMKIEPKYVCPEWKTEVSAEIGNKQCGSITGTVSEYIQGLKTSIKYDGSKDMKITAGVEYKNKSFGTVKTDIDFTGDNKTALNAGLVYTKNDISFGVEGRATLSGTPALENANAAVQLTKPDYTACLFVKHIHGADGDKHSVAASFIKNVDQYTAAAEASFDVNKSETTVQVGIQKQICEMCAIKAKFDTKGVLSVGYKRVLNNNSTFTFGGDVNTSTFTGKSGVQVNVNI